MYNNKKIAVVMPAYNASKTLEKTVQEVKDQGIVDFIIVVDDASKDNTVDVARKIPEVEVIQHPQNRGYGGNQKTCYKTALERGADIIIMVHPDYQYTPQLIPAMASMIGNNLYDCVLASRILGGGSLKGGMPLWKHNANIFLTAFENVILHTYLTEYHSGFRAYSARLLKSIRFKENSDGFLFDTEIIVQLLLKKFRIEEIPIRTRYFPEASTVGFWCGVVYGLGIIRTMLKYILHAKGIIKFRQFT